MGLDSFVVYKNRIKQLSLSKVRTNGRNMFGRICVRYRGGGSKRRYVFVDYYKRWMFLPGLVRRVESIKNITSFVFLVCYYNGFLGYVLGIEGLGVNSYILTFSIFFKNPPLGFHLKLKYIPRGFFVHNVSFAIFTTGKIARSAGTFCQLLTHICVGTARYVLLKLPSTEIRALNANCFGTIGIVSNSQLKHFKMYKAGQNRWLGLKPNVRGVAKNPVDHPHGGGQGKTSGGRCSVSPKGILTKGWLTKRGKHKFNRFVLESRRNLKFGFKL